MIVVEARRSARCLASLCLIFLAGCSSSSVGGTGIALTIRFDASVDDATIARVTGLRFEVSGGESFDQTLALGRAAQRVERLVYRPSAPGETVTLVVSALDATQALASGSVGPVQMVAGKVAMATVTLGVSTFDLGEADGGGLSDGGSAPIVFSAVDTIAVPGGQGDVAVGNLNGDARADVAAAFRGGGMVEVFFTGPNGTVPAKPSLSFTDAVAPSALAIADFDGDGSQDLAVLDANDGSVIVYRGDAKGGLVAKPRVAVGMGVDAMAAADFDHDGAADLVLTSSSAAVFEVLYADGEIQSGTTHAPADRVQVADVDRDGYVDFVASERNASPELFYDLQSTMPRTFSTSIEFGRPMPTSAAVLDLDGDGINEMLFFGTQGVNNSVVTRAENIGNHNDYSEYGSVDQQFVFRAFTSDVDGDLLADVIGTSAGSFQYLFLALSRNGTAPNFLNGPDSLRIFALAGDAGPFAVGDLDADGVLDAVVLDTTTQLLSIARGDGHAGFYGGKLAATAGPPRVYDYDGDGIADLVLHGTDVTLEQGDGFFGFGGGTQVSATSSTCSAVADLDGDGRLDIVVGQSDGTAGIGLGAGSSFATPTYTSYGSQIADLRIADMTGDGTLDIVLLDVGAAATGNSANLVVLPGNGSGGVGSPIHYAAPGANAFVTVDVNGDLHSDLVALTQTGQVYVFLGSSTGLGGSTHFSGGVSTPVALTTLDADGDGGVDLATCGGGGAHVLAGHGDGTFTDRGSVYDGACVSISSGRLNADTRDDLILATDHSIVALPNAVASASPHELGAGSNVVTLVAADLDGDERADVFTYTAAGQSWLIENLSP